MGSNTAYSTVISGLRNAQLGLVTTGHNISNTNSKGYTRQQNIQNDYRYSTLSNQAIGSFKMKEGMGAAIANIRQIRNQFYDIKYREASSVESYYEAKAKAGEEIQAIFGELETEYTVQEIFTDIWNCINDLVSHPDGLETRSNFIQTCNTFITKVKNVSDSLLDFQMNLNEQVKDAVERINTLIDKISVANDKIIHYSAGDLNPNDYLDERNNYLDELSEYLDIDIKSEPNGGIQILTEGNELLANGVCQHLGLKYSSSEYPFVMPVFTESDEILTVNEDTARELYPNLDTDVLTIDSEKTSGKLKGLLIARGKTVANYTTSELETGNYLIPKTQKYFDTLVNAVATLFNDTLSPKSGQKPADLHGDRTGVELFVRSSGYDRSIEEDTGDYNSLYTTNNIEVNPEILEPDGYNLLCFSPSGDPGDTDLLNELSDHWKTGLEKLENMSVDTYYARFITDIAIEIEEAQNQADVMTSTAEITDDARKTISGVSLDEELTSMLKYQYAYQAAAKMLNVIDSMVDKIVNQMV